VDLDAFKMIYIAPMKSLVQEMVSNFGKVCMGTGRFLLTLFDFHEVVLFVLLVFFFFLPFV
jgi:hypothetical protein